MKSYIKILSAGLCTAALALTSCVGDLDLQPNNPNLIPGNTLTPAEYNNILSKCYGGLAYSGQTGPNGNCDISGLDGGTSQYTRALFMMNEFTTDEAIWIHADNGVIDLVTNTWGKDNPNVFGTYSRLYSHIAVCNDFIRQAKSSDEKSVRKMVLEARALRAMSYYWVIDIFGQGSFTLDTDEFGSSPVQKDRTFLYNWLDGELDDIATQYKQEFPENDVMYGHVGLDGVQALHARLCLNSLVYTNKAVNAYDKCAKLCDEVIARHLGGGFNGSGLAEYYNYLFCASNDAYMPGGSNKAENEILWGIPYQKDYTQAYGGTQFLIAASTANANTKEDGTMSLDYGINNPWKCMHATQQFSSKFDRNPEDMRWAEWLKEGNGFTKDNAVYGKFFSGYAVIKFTNLIAGEYGMWSEENGGIYGDAPARAETWVDTDLPLIRLADVYLMYAEAYIVNGSGTQAKALEYANYVRERAGVTPWNAPDLTAENILDERCRELYWELTRRSDLVRHGKFSGNAYLWSYKGSQTNQDGQAFRSYMDIMPIPTNIIGAQPEFKQNPNY